MENFISAKEFPVLFEHPNPQPPLLEDFTLILGPCAVESELQIYQIAEALNQRGIRYLRGGAFKPRTRPQDFKGLGEQGLQYMQKAAKQHNLKVVTEVMSESDLEMVANYADILQIGTRNMFNYSLLKKLGTINKPILLKRGFSATVKEYLHAAEYILAGGNRQIILCERGIRSHDPLMRNVLDLASAIAIKQATGLPVIIDPSHATGIPALVAPLTLAAQVSGLDGAIIEMSLAPEHATCDGHQAITLTQLDTILQKVHALKTLNQTSAYSII